MGFISTKLYALGAEARKLKVLTFQSESSITEHEIADIHTVITYSYMIGGKIKRYSTNVTKLKKGYRTLREQAEAEAISKYDEKINTEGYKPLRWYHDVIVQMGSELEYSTDDKSAYRIIQEYVKLTGIDYNLDRKNRFMSMLANKFDLAKTLQLQKEFFFVDYKYNGVRTHAFTPHKWKNQVVLYSRGGIEYSVPHIENTLSSIQMVFNDCNVWLDGELYEHGKTLQDIVSSAKANNIGTTTLDYVCYDAILWEYLKTPNGNVVEVRSPDGERRPLMKKIGSHTTAMRNAITKGIVNAINSKSIMLAKRERIEVTSDLNEMADKVTEIFQKALQEKYEGVMIRDNHSPYAVSFRVNGLLKIKKSESAEFTILGVNLKDRSKPENFVWVLQTPEGRVFEATAHGTVPEKILLYNSYEKYIGKKMSLTFVEYTKDKIPSHITEMIIRDYES